MSRSSFFLFSILACFSCCHVCAQSNDKGGENKACMVMSHGHRLSVSHREGGGIGYNQGYTSLDAFFSLPSKNDVVPFFDFRSHLFNDGRWAANAGFGIRKLLSDNWIIGGNAFYDYRRASHTTFNQLGCGLELIGEKWEIHGNVYIPVGHNRRNYANVFRKFEGHSAFFTRKYEYAFSGADLLAGRELWSSNNYRIRGALGAYFLKGHFSRGGGGLLKLAAELTHYLFLEGQLSYDNIFKWRPQAELRVNIPIGKKVHVRRNELNCKKQSAITRALVAPAERFEIIAKHNRKKKAIAVDPNTGLPLNFVFVDNLRGHSDGSFENPFATLLEAQNGSNINDVIYVFPGDGTDTGMNQGMILQQGQQFIGSSVAFPVSLNGGILANIPQQTTSSPHISNTGDAIKIATANRVSGFTISSTAYGMIGGDPLPGEAGVSDTTISNNVFNVDLNCINLRNVTGNINISNNQDNDSLGILLSTNSSGSSEISITNNNLVSNNINIQINTNGTHQANVVIDNNLIAQAPNEGIYLNQSDTTITNAVISNNIVNGCQEGIYIFATANAQGNISLINNLVSQIQIEGIICETANSGLLNLNIQGNTVTQNNLSGSTHSGINVINAAASQITLRLVGNSSFPANNALGYIFENAGGPFYVESPDLTINGVQLINSGTYPIFLEGLGSITFIPLMGL